APEAVGLGGFAAEIAAAVGAAAFDSLDAPIERVGAPFTPVPLSPPLEDAYLPAAAEICTAARAALGLVGVRRGDERATLRIAARLSARRRAAGPSRRRG